MISIYLFILRHQNQKKNSYIDVHQKKKLDDLKYKSYLKWCEKENEIPIDKRGFEDIRNKEKSLYEGLEKHGINKFE